MNITEKAISEVKKIFVEQEMKPEDTALRVSVVGGGCSGFSYKLMLESLEGVDLSKYTSLEFDGVKAIVDNRSMLYLEQVTIDFHDGLDKRGFIFDNPAAVSKCGCGSSFSM